MNKSAIRNFSARARNKLVEGITQSACELGISKDGIKDVEVSEDSFKVKGIESKTFKIYQEKQRRKLVERIEQKSFDKVIEEVSYTWFVRIITLRFMEVNDYLPTGIRVLSSKQEGKTEPDIIGEALNIDLQVDRQIIYRLIDNNDIEDLYKYLLIKQCNQMSKIMPTVFEEISDDAELLLPRGLLSGKSVIWDLVESIPEEDYRQVEIIGWLYQYYISEKKDQVFADLKKNKKITKENIPVATQLFTPKWIVKYMVENSLGRLWLDSHPSKQLKSQWKYYLEEVEQEPGVMQKLEELNDINLSPEDIKVLDPAMGSGHILVYAFDVLYDIYLKANYRVYEIPRLILEKNLYGLDIDDRARQLTSFALMMKARSKNEKLFKKKIELNICSIQESNDISRINLRTFNPTECSRRDLWSSVLARYMGELWPLITYLIDVFNDAKEYGSILEVKPIDFDAVEKKIEEIKSRESSDLFELQYRNILLEKLPPLIKQAKIMSQKYDVICTNPPYIGLRNLNNNLATYVKEEYPISKYDLFSVFIEKCFKFSKINGYQAFITMHSWMFLSSFERFRKKTLLNDVINLIHLGTKGFEDDVGTIVQTASFVFRSSNLPNYKSTFIDLTNYQNLNEKEMQYKEEKNYHIVKKNAFFKVKGYPIAYWISDNLGEAFENGIALNTIAETRQGMATSDNKRFIRLWHEVDFDRIAFNCKSTFEAKSSRAKWFPYNKGGQFRKWYGNNKWIINWENDGFELKEYAKKLYGTPTRTIKSIDKYFKEAVTWPYITDSSRFGVRYQPHGFIFDVAGSSLFTDKSYRYYLMGLMCSKVSIELMKVINPTMNFQSGDIARIPVIVDNRYKTEVEELSKQCISIAEQDWDRSENSWNFEGHPLISYPISPSDSSVKIETVFNKWAAFNKGQFLKLKSNEKELNRIFIKIYQLEDEIEPEVQDVTIGRADRESTIKSLISYAVGCMFGRYSLDQNGLIYGGDEFNSKFKTDNQKVKIRIDNGWKESSIDIALDNIILITEGDYFNDDIASRFVKFIKVAFGKETLEENLDYIANALGSKPDETSRQTIRRYFLKGFYKEHVSRYQKRPIYWLFDSGRQNGFKALIYMHRYNINTVADIRINYLQKLQNKYQDEIRNLNILLKSELSSKDKSIAIKRKNNILKKERECIIYDQIIAHIANKKIEINLDDGVQFNYQKFQGIEIPQKQGKEALIANALTRL